MIFGVYRRRDPRHTMPISSHPEPNDAEREQELTLIGRLTSPDAFVAAAQPIELIVSVEKRAETTNVSRAQTECTCENKEKKYDRNKIQGSWSVRDAIQHGFSAERHRMRRQPARKMRALSDVARIFFWQKGGSSSTPPSFLRHCAAS